MTTKPVSPSDQAECVRLVLRELERARAKFPAFNSAHEGYAVILEELDEMWDEIKRNDTERARDECVQVAAMALRFLCDVALATKARDG